MVTTPKVRTIYRSSRGLAAHPKSPSSPDASPRPSRRAIGGTLPSLQDERGVGDPTLGRHRHEEFFGRPPGAGTSTPLTLPCRPSRNAGRLARIDPQAVGASPRSSKPSPRRLLDPAASPPAGRVAFGARHLQGTGWDAGDAPRRRPGARTSRRRPRRAASPDWATMPTRLPRRSIHHGHRGDIRAARGHPKVDRLRLGDVSHADITQSA